MRKTENWNRALVALGLATAFGWIYLAGLSAVEDANGEAMATPITVAWLGLASRDGLSLPAFLEKNPVMRNMQEQEPVFRPYPRGRSPLEHFAHVEPLLITLYLPFVKAFGVSVKTIEAFSAFFSACAVIVAAVFAARVFGWRHAAFATLALFSSLAWLIHVKVGYEHHFPSVTLMALLFLALLGCARTPDNRWYPVLVGVLLGLMYLMAWIVFAFGLLAWALAAPLLGPRKPVRLLAHAGLTLGTGCLVTAALVFLYAHAAHVSPREVHRAVLDQYLSRYEQGEPGFEELNTANRSFYAFKCMFVDGQTLDGHVDKYLEGKPAVPWLFSGLFLLGLLYAIRDHTLGDKLVLVWVVSVFAPLGLIFIFGHRYALLAIPAMGMLAARGGIGLVDDLLRSGRRTLAWALGALLVAGMAFSVHVTRKAYYVDYTLHKPANFEIDRQRGHAQLAAWLRANFPPDDTLVVLGDGVNLAYGWLLFHTFDRPYPYVYWSNYFSPRSAPEQALEWERAYLKKHKRVVYAFSTQILDHAWFPFLTNNWSPFLAAHPSLSACWSYSYSGRSPSIVAFVVERPAPAARPAGAPERTPAARKGPRARNDVRQGG